MQEHTRQWSSLPLLAMHPTLTFPRYQTRPLQRLLDPRITQPDLVLLPQLLVKVLRFKSKYCLDTVPELAPP
jgi:hypothetical protein